MTIALVASAGAHNTSSGATTSSVDTTGANFIALCIVSYPGGADPTVTDSKSNSYSLTGTKYSGAFAWIRWYYCESPTVGSGHTFTVSGTGSYSVIAALAYSGVASSSSIDVQNGGTFSGSTSAAVGSITPTVNGDVLLAGWGMDSAWAPGSPSVDSSYTIQYTTPNVRDTSFGITVADFVQGTAGAKNPTLSWTTSSGGASAAISFKAGTGASLPTLTAATISNITSSGARVTVSA